MLVEALKRLEYRGYDSAGIATLNDGHLDRRRAVGKLINLSDLLVHEPLARQVGHRPHPLGHPWRADRAQRPPAPGGLRRRGPQRHHRELPRPSRRACRPKATASRPRPTPRPSSSSATASCASAARRSRPPAGHWPACDGAFALCFLFDGEGDLMIAARRARRSPSAMATARCSWAPTPRAGAADRPHHLSRRGRLGGPHARRRADLRRRRRRRRTAPIHDVPAGERYADRKGRLQALHGQGDRTSSPSVVARRWHATRRRTGSRVRAARRDRLHGRPTGSRWSPAAPPHYACHVAKYWFEQHCRPAGRDRHRLRVPLPRAAASARARSASSSASRARPPTRWPRCAMCGAPAGRSLSIVNVETSTIARESDVALPILAGPEIGVASTKAFTCQLTVLATAGAHGRRPPARQSDAAAEAELVAALRSAAGPDRPRAGAANPRSPRSPTTSAKAPRRALPRPRRDVSRWRWKAR